VNRRRPPVILTERGENLLILAITAAKALGILIAFLATLSLVGAIENGLIP
jgi:hypothetical protein